MGNQIYSRKDVSPIQGCKIFIYAIKNGLLEHLSNSEFQNIRKKRGKEIENKA